MRTFVRLALMAVAVVVSPAYAEMKIAVLNYQQALLESDAAKKYAVEAEQKFGPRYNKIKGIEAEAKRLQDRLIKDGQTMQKSDRERLEADFNQKVRDFQLQARQLSEAKANSDRDMMEVIKPKLDNAIKAVIKEGGYDLVLERGAVVDVKPQYEITAQVIKRVNGQR